jgi:SAM-dependent methyltransferase
VIDLAVCTEVLEHVEDLNLAFGEISRILRSGGHAVISSPNYLNPMGLRKWRNDWRMGESYWDPWGGHPGFERLMLPRTVSKAFRSRFTVRAVLGAGYLMAWIPLGYRRIGRLSDSFPLRAAGRLPLLRHLGMNRYLLLKKIAAETHGFGSADSQP